VEGGDRGGDNCGLSAEDAMGWAYLLLVVVVAGSVSSHEWMKTYVAL
jgi:hypothetical protein